MTDLLKDKKRKANGRRRASEHYGALRDRGGARVCVTLEPAELRAVEAMRGYAEATATAVRRVVVDEARRRGLL